MRYPYTDEDIQRMSAAGRDVKNWTPSTPEERAEGREQGRRMATRIAAAFTDDDWRYLLNTVPPERAAKAVALRPPEDRQRVLGFVSEDRISEVEQFLTVTV